MKKSIFLTAGIIYLTASGVYAQSDFEQYKQERQREFAEYTRKTREEFKNYRDSLNREFASFLEKEWKSFDLQKPEPVISKPISTPPVYDPSRAIPPTEQLPITKHPVISVPKPVTPAPTPKTIPVPKQIPAPDNTINSLFFGTSIQLKNIAVSKLSLSGMDEKDIAKYWKSLINTPYVDIMNESQRIQSELGLNDWGIYQLLGKMFKVYFPDGTDNEQAVFTVFMLNQMGFRAKIAKTDRDLLPLIAFNNHITNCVYFSYGENRPVKYYAIDSQRRELSSVRTCPVDYADAVNNMDLKFTQPPLFTPAPIEKPLAWNDNTYLLKYNKNIVDYYKNYPCVEFSVYAEVALDKTFSQSIEEEIAPKLINKSQEEAVNWLLHFVQSAFRYKTDEHQFGYEKWNFAEETIASSYSDCEDRSILFAQLVRRVLNMPVVLVYYPGQHLATAVEFSNSNLQGDYILVDEKKYLICDPTYINANIGMAMPNLRNVAIEVFKVEKN